MLVNLKTINDDDDWQVYRQTLQTVDGKGIKGTRFNNLLVKDGLSNLLEFRNLFQCTTAWSFIKVQSQCQVWKCDKCLQRMHNCVNKSGDRPIFL